MYVNVYKYKYILEQEVHRQTTQDSQQDLNKENMLHANDAEVFFMQTLLYRNRDSTKKKWMDNGIHVRYKLFGIFAAYCYTLQT